MKSLAGFWAGVYAYDLGGHPKVKFDCELLQNGASVTGHITEADIFRNSGIFILESILDGQIHKRDVCFTKSYITVSDIYNQPVEYVGKLGLMGNQISGRWFIGSFSGTFSLKRDRKSSNKVHARLVANDVISK